MERGYPLILSGRDHAALAVMPITVASGHRELKPWRYSYQLTIDSKVRRVEVCLEPGSAGWPTHEDQLVYLALLQLAVRQDARSTLTCRRTEIFGLLGWPNAGYYYSRLTSALQRLTALTVFISSAMLARNGRPYSSSEKGTHIIDTFKIEDCYDATIKVEWGGLVREAFELDDLKRLDWTLIKEIDNPTAVQLYRLIDRATLSGEPEWKVGWKTLGQALGMHTGYDRPAKFKDKIRAHADRLQENGIIEDWEYERGGNFRFLMNNHFRAGLRKALETAGVYPEAARQLVVGYDELHIICQLDCLHFGNRAHPEQPGGFLTEAIRQGWELSYPDDEREAFEGMMSMLDACEREAYQQAALKLCGEQESLFSTSQDPAAWPLEMRAVVRFMIRHSIEPTIV